jgi:hypothetical protein
MREKDVRGPREGEIKETVYMTGKGLRVFAVLLVFILSGSAMARGGDEDAMQRYPGGEYGMDIGGGYAMTPDGQLLEPSEYRDPYIDTKYGPLTRKGFMFFPQDKVGGSTTPKPVEKKAEVKDFIFFEAPVSGEATTSAQSETSTGSSLWGVYSPGND